MEQTIIAKGLSKSYDAITAIENITFSISRGEIFGLLGANGAGKSTTLECLLETKSADQGTVSILGQNPSQHRKSLFQRVGVQFQQTSFQDKITVRELCGLTQSLYHAPKDYRELLPLFGLAEKNRALVSSLSGGQQQRLFIVLALLPDPEVLFLDELTTGLDVKARHEVWDYLITRRKKGTTIFLTSHFMDEVEALCDKIMILRQGKSVFYGTPNQAVETSPFHTLEDAYLWYCGEGK